MTEPKASTPADHEPPESESPDTFLPIFDGHNDTLLRIWDQQHDPQGFLDGFDGEGRDAGHLDLPRALSGGFCGGFFAMFVPSQRRSDRNRRQRPRAEPPSAGSKSVDKPKARGDDRTENRFRFPYPKSITAETAIAATSEMLDLARLLERTSAGRFKIVESIAQLDQAVASWNTGVSPTGRHRGQAEERTVSAILHLEGAEAVSSDLSNLEALFQRGVRSIGPVWSRANDFAQGVPFAFPCSPNEGPGLSDAGFALIRACQELGILIDLAHLNEKGFWDVARTSQRPLVATHTAAHSLTAKARNLTDDQIDAIGESQGLIGVNLHVADLRADGRWNSDMPLDRWAEHVGYLADRIGPGCVALGSDFDGAMMSQELGDARGLQRLVQALVRKGFGEDELNLFAYENWRRVLSRAWNSSEPTAAHK